MNNPMKRWSNAWLDFAVCIALSSASVLAIEALTPRDSDAGVSDSLNAADMNLRVGNTDIACSMVSHAIVEANSGQTTTSQRSEIADHARRHNLRF